MAETRPDIGERTKIQGGAVIGGIPSATILLRPGTYATYRLMRTDPTIALARAVVMAPIQAAQWSVEAKDDTPDERVAFIKDQFIEQRTLILADALRGGLDYGWQGWEKIFELRENRLRIRRFKPLLHDITHIEADKTTGNFMGYKQGEIIVPLENALIYTHDREGDNHYGRSRLENIRRTWSGWMDCNDGAARYDKKIAGAWIVVHYPIGTSRDKDGTERPNWEIARDILNGIVASGQIAVPNSFAGEVDDLNNQRPEKRQWMIEVLEDKGGRQPQFIDRLRYLDSLKFRGMLRPERAAMEGQFGTKAESESQADMSLVEGEQLHQDIVRTINWHAVDQVLALNYGEESRGSVWLSPMPLQDAKRGTYQQIIAAMLQNPTTMLELFTEIDRDAVFDLLDIPKSEQIVDSGIGGPRPPDMDTTDPRAEAVMSIYRNMLEPSNGRN